MSAWTAEDDLVISDPTDDDAPSAAGDGGRRLILTPASRIRPRRVRWLWDGRLALGTLSLLAGAEGLGKSTLAYWLAARITRGELPGEDARHPRSVLVCATEDSWDYTIVPRLIASGADLDRVFQVEIATAGGIHSTLSLPRDLHAVEDAATYSDASLLILDPLMSRLDGALDTHRDAEVRQALEPLVAVADRTRMAVLGLIHHNKSGSTDPLQLVMASKAFTAVARSVHSVVRDPEDESDRRRLFGTPKNNLGSCDLPTLAFTIASHAVSTDDGTAWTGRLEWAGEVSGTIADAVRRGSLDDETRTATGEAAAWLADYVQASGGRASSASIRAAGKIAGHSVDALKRARTRVGLDVESEGFPRVTYWCSPVSAAPSPVGAAPSRQLEQQLAHLPWGESPTALTALTEGHSGQSVQLVQSAGVLGTPAPTDALTAEEGTS